MLIKTRPKQLLIDSRLKVFTSKIKAFLKGNLMFSVGSRAALSCSCPHARIERGLSIVL